MSESQIKETTKDLIDSFEGICSNLLRPMSEQFTRFRINEIESKLAELQKDIAKMQGKILDLSRRSEK
tara:strand:- start:607 stop:810 length:204 start_codon:yes stop_codon:yes gene_type:complete